MLFFITWRFSEHVFFSVAVWHCVWLIFRAIK